MARDAMYRACFPIGLSRETIVVEVSPADCSKEASAEFVRPTKFLMDCRSGSFTLSGEAAVESLDSFSAMVASSREESD